MVEQQGSGTFGARTVVAFVVGLAVGVALIAPGWTGPVLEISSGRAAVLVGVAVVALLAFTVLMWLFVVTVILR